MRALFFSLPYSYVVAPQRGRRRHGRPGSIQAAYLLRLLAAERQG